ncbi:hypothetical protein PM082_013862 [Marasmius tenuissimus]|nr:hypothetical protein PM082_013862 [Marasmius tenuissimus]
MRTELLPNHRRRGTEVEPAWLPIRASHEIQPGHRDPENTEEASSSVVPQSTNDKTARFPPKQSIRVDHTSRACFDYRIECNARARRVLEPRLLGHIIADSKTCEEEAWVVWIVRVVGTRRIGFCSRRTQEWVECGQGVRVS